MIVEHLVEASQAADIQSARIAPVIAPDTEPSTNLPVEMPARPSLKEKIDFVLSRLPVRTLGQERPLAAILAEAGLPPGASVSEVLWDLKLRDSATD